MKIYALVYNYTKWDRKNFDCGVAFRQEPVSQITASAALSGVSLYAWGNVLLQREPHQYDLNELDFGASYAYGLGDFTLEPAFDAYVFRVPRPAKRSTPPRDP